MKASKQQAEQYEKLKQEYTPKPPVLKNVFWAFVVGGIICTIGQVVMNFFLSQGVKPADGGGATAAVMVFLGAILTGLGVYDEIGKLAGAGSIVPITGFSNSMVAPAMEFKREGHVFGIGARLFTIAGPVLVFGITTSVIVGLIHWLIVR